MIEQVNGAGLSGMTDKPTKHGKNSLFAKLVSMLEKNMELSGKGKGLQLHAGKLNKGEGLAGLSEKADPFMLAKNKHLLALAAKGRLEGKGKAEGEDVTIPLLTAHVIIDSSAQLKKTGQDGVHTGLIKGFGNSDQGNAGLNKGFGKSDQGNAGLNKGSEKPDQGNVLLDKMAQIVAGKHADVLAAQQKGPLEQASQLKQSAQNPVDTDLKSALLASGKGDASDPLAQKGQLSEQVLKAAQQANLGQAGTATGNGSTHNKVDLDTALRTAEGSLLGDKKEAMAAQIKHGSGEKPDVKTLAEVMSLAAAAHAQKPKAVQPQQTQQPVTASVTSAGQISISDASLTDSGSQSSDQKGGQDARLLNAVIGDAKSTSSSTSTQSNFQSYLTSKATPPMSIFDSMNHIAQSAKNGQTKIEIQLDPANLGKIHISLQSDASKQLQVHMIVDQSMTRAALEQQLPQLRSALAQQGFDLSGFSMDSQDQQASNGGDDKAQKPHKFSDQADMNTADMPIAQSQRAMPGSGLSIRV